MGLLRLGGLAWTGSLDQFGCQPSGLFPRKPDQLMITKLSRPALLAIPNHPTGCALSHRISVHDLASREKPDKGGRRSKYGAALVEFLWPGLSFRNARHASLAQYILFCTAPDSTFNN